MWLSVGADMVVLEVRRCESCWVFPRPPDCLLRSPVHILQFLGQQRLQTSRGPWKPGDYVAPSFEISLPSAGTRERRDPGV